MLSEKLRNKRIRNDYFRNCSSYIEAHSLASIIEDWSVTNRVEFISESVRRYDIFSPSVHSSLVQLLVHLRAKNSTIISFASLAWR